MTDLHYPVFRLGVDSPVVENGIVLYMYQHVNDDGTTYNTYRVVDDTNLPGATLPLRRLKLLHMGVKLKKINRAIFFLGDLIKIATPKTWFIDSSGKLFKYAKATRVSLEFRKITKVMPIQSGGAILEIQDINTRFKTMYIPKSTERYAGVLKYGMSYILYGVYDQKYDSTWRMI